MVFLAVKCSYVVFINMVAHTNKF